MPYSGREIYNIWAPQGAKWTDWVRPVPFISAADSFNTERICNLTIPDIGYINKIHSDTAIIVDLPGYEGVEEGLSLARLGYRPIPLYNGTMEQDNAMALVDNGIIAVALKAGASELEKTKTTGEAPPAFLLDSNRTHRYKMNISIYDNSWDIYPQDLPSAGYFLDNGINKLIVRSEKIQKDLAKILYGFQKKGILILFTNGYDTPKPVIIKKPKRD